MSSAQKYMSIKHETCLPTLVRNRNFLGKILNLFKRLSVKVKHRLTFKIFLGVFRVRPCGGVQVLTVNHNTPAGSPAEDPSPVNPMSVPTCVPRQKEIAVF